MPDKERGKNFRCGHLPAKLKEQTVKKVDG